MTEAATPAAAAAATTAGALLRAARERQGLHLAALAASIKVAPRKLEALEADRYDELPDPAFTRALAQTMCKALKIDAAPVLALLPRAEGVGRLERVASGLQTPFRDHGGAEPLGEGGWLTRPAFWAPALVLVAALVLYFLPSSLFDERSDVADAPLVTVVPPAAGPATPPAAPAAGTPPPAAPSPAPMVETVHSAPPPDEPASEPPPASTALLSLRASEASWVEVRDGQGNVLLSRTLQAGEAVGLDGALPLRATIGNTAGVSVAFRGEPIDLSASARGNVARLELR